MPRYQPLSREDVDILLKCYYLRSCPKAAASEGMSVSRVRGIRENALRVIRLAYSKSHQQGLGFNGGLVLQHMAERCGMETSALSEHLDQIILEGLASENRKYWERIRKRGDVPNAAELLDFLYDKYEVEVEGGIR